ncbi:hypothetical protein ABIB39_002727 [Mucilaginibacter sp. UYP27]
MRSKKNYNIFKIIFTSKLKKPPFTQENRIIVD